MVEMRRRQDDARSVKPVEFGPTWGSALPTMAIAPQIVFSVEPPAIKDAQHLGLVPSAAGLATTFGADEPDLPAQLRPVDGIESA